MLDCPKSILQSHMAWTNNILSRNATRMRLVRCTMHHYVIFVTVLYGWRVYAVQPQIFTSRQHPRSVSVVARENCLLEASYLQVGTAVAT